MEFAENMYIGQGVKFSKDIIEKLKNKKTATDVGNLSTSSVFQNI